MKKVLAVHGRAPLHWVGDGFPVRSSFSYSQDAESRSPFLLLDHAAPSEFTPTTRRRGVGEHPHRGFETVTIVYQGELEHRDSTGAGGRIGPGDVQWMTAGSGILHEEYHSEAFAAAGGTLEMVQLWVNLPARHKMTAPGYQTLASGDIPVVELPDGAGSLRVIAGEHAGRRGPARTFTPMDVWDIRLEKAGRARFDVPDGHTLAVVVLRGAARVNGELARDGQWIELDREGTGVEMESDGGAGLLLLCGEPLNEPVVGYGPFVMNSAEQIAQALDDFNGGRFGRLHQPA